MDVKQLSKHHGIVRLEDWSGLDRTGATNMAAKVQAWQDQAAADKRIAVAGAGTFGLAQQVLFKAPTIGAGGALYGAQNPVTTGAYTQFKNLAINDNSWMIDIVTASPDSGTFGLLKGMRFHAGGLACSLVRVRGVESVPAGFSWEKFLWEDIVGYGGWVNFQHYGYGGEIRNVYSKAAKLSAFRAYLCNALRVSGGWFGVDNKDAWEFELFRRGATSTENISNITFNATVFQSEGFGGVGNGLRIPEGALQVDINSYFEEHKNVAGGGIALSVGEYNGCHVDGTIPTALDLAGADAPTNDESRAARNITINRSSLGVYGTYTINDQYPQYRFGNVHGIKWDGNYRGGGLIVYSKNAKDIVSTSLEPAFRLNLSGIGGQNPTATASAGATTISVAFTANFFVGPKLYVEMVPVVGKPAWFETTILSKVLNTSITIADAIPTGRSVTSAQIVSHNRSWHSPDSLREDDARDRGGPSVSLMPYGNFLGSTGTTMRGVKEAVFGRTDGSFSLNTDYVVRRNGRPTLRMTRHGAAFPGINYPQSVSFYPFGADQFISGAINTVAITGWVKVETVAPYSTYVDSPLMGLTWTNANGEVLSPIQINFIGVGNYTQANKWTYISYLFELNDTGITKLGMNLWVVGGQATQNYDHSVWFDSLEMFINPRSLQELKDGHYQRNPGAGYFDAASKFQADVTAVPSSARLRVEVGDRFRNTAAAVGQPKAWTVTVAGPANTATFTSEGNL